MGEARNDAGARDVADGIASAVSRLRRCKDTHTYVCIYLSVYPSMGLCVRGVMLMLDALRHAKAYHLDNSLGNLLDAGCLATRPRPRESSLLRRLFTLVRHLGGLEGG